MGCQNSRLVNPDILAIPPKLRPLLWRKVEEIRRRRGGATAESTLSKKELLTSEGGAGREESEAFSHQSVRENESSSPDDLNSVSSLGSQPKSTQQENNVSEETRDQAERTETKEDEKEEKDNNDNNSREEKEEKDMNNNNDDDDDDDEGEKDCDEERNIGPGSPSFRVYYIESLVVKKDHVEESIHTGNNNDNTQDENVDDMQKKCSRESSVDSIVVREDQEPIEEEQEAKIATKRGKNRMRITRAICRGPIAMKHLLHVTSCYHPSNERASLLAKKIDP